MSNEEQLERMIDDKGLAEVLWMIASIASGKADHITQYRTNINEPDPTEKLWIEASEAVGKAAAKVEV